MDNHMISIIALWAPRIVIPTLLAFTALVFLRRKDEEGDKFRRRLWLLIGATVLFAVGYAFLLTIGQYVAWKNGTELTKFLITAPVGTVVPFPGILEFARPLFNHPGGYFVFYALGRFWFRVGLLLLVSLVFYIFLRLLRKYRSHFFAEGETELGFLAALLSGWPSVLIFIPCSLFITVLIAFYRLNVLKEPRTTLGISFILAVVGIFVLSIFSDPAAFFHISVLNI